MRIRNRWYTGSDGGLLGGPMAASIQVLIAILSGCPHLIHNLTEVNSSHPKMTDSENAHRIYFARVEDLMKCQIIIPM